MVSTKGLLLHLSRTRGAYPLARKQIAGRRHWSRAEFDNYSRGEFRKLVAWATSEVEWYKNRERNYLPGDLNQDFICRLPILSKQQVREGGLAFAARHRRRGYQDVQTTGTTGTPLRIFCDNAARQLNYAFFDDYIASVGIDPSGKHVVLGGRVIVPPSQRTPPFWRHSVFQNALLMSSYHLQKDNIGTYIEAIQDFAPEYIEAYPSSIYFVARHALQSKRRAFGVRGIITSAETLDTEQREVIERAFSCPVYDQYGCAEMAMFAGQCIYGSYHIRPDYGHVEILDDNDVAVPDGVVGRVITTGFINYAMPLVRYDTGDLGAIDRQSSCSCGLQTPVLTVLQGRQDDVVICGNGSTVGRLGSVLRGMPVEEAQYVQRVPGEIELNLVPANTFDPSMDIMRIAEALHMRVGKETKIYINLVSQIERGAGGKHKTVVSLIGKRAL